MEKIIHGTLAEQLERMNLDRCKGEYEKFFQDVGRLVDEKHVAYGDSFGKSGDVLRIFYPNGITTEQYDDMLAIVRIIDKQFRIATNKDAFGESPFKDICGYSGLGAKRHEDIKNGKQKS